MESTEKQKFLVVTTLERTKFTTKKDPIDFNANVGEMILNAFKCKPDFIGQIDANTQQQTTFQEMREKSIKCALWLKSNGISAKNIVAICTHNEMDVYVPFLACLYLNAVAYIWNNVFFDHNKPLCLLWRTNPDIIFIQDCYVSQLCKAIRMLPKYVDLLSEKKIVVFGATEMFTSFESIMCTSVCVKEIDEFSCTKCLLRKTAMIMYTTNNFGYMDEIQFPYISFISPSNQYPPKMNFGGIGLWCEPFWWTYSPLLTVRAILSYVTTIKTLATMYNIEVIYQLIEKYKVTWIFLKYSISLEIETIENIVQQYDISSLEQFVYHCPNAKNIEIIEKHTSYLPYSVACIRVYGAPEIGIIASDANNGGGMSKDNHVIFSNINKNIELIIVSNKTRMIIDPWIYGEIWCKSPCLISANNKNARLILGLNDYKTEWFYTGDVGYIENGIIFIYDKVSRVLYDCYFSELNFQLELQNNPKVSNVVVQFVSSRSGQRPVIYIWPKPGEKVTEEEVRETIKKNIDQHLSHWSIIRIVRDDLPLYPDGEINQRRVQSIEYVRDMCKRSDAKRSCNLCNFSTKRNCGTIKI